MSTFSLFQLSDISHRKPRLWLTNSITVTQR